MAILKEVVAIVGKYTDKNGAEKNQYMTIGKVLETKNGSQMVKFDSIPIAWDGWAYLNDPRPRDNDKPATQNQEASPVINEEDLPF